MIASGLRVAALVLAIQAPVAESVPATAAEAIRQAKIAGEAKDGARVEALLRSAHRKWPDDLMVKSYLGAVLFSSRRIDESYPLLSRVCTDGGHEAACAVSAGIDLIRNRWTTAFSIASSFSESACQKSDRLWTLKLLATDSKQAVEVAGRLLQASPEEEISYLLLAFAQWRAGDCERSLDTLDLVKQRAKKVILLAELISWPRKAAAIRR